MTESIRQELIIFVCRSSLSLRVEVVRVVVNLLQSNPLIVNGHQVVPLHISLAKSVSSQQDRRHKSRSYCDPCGRPSYLSPLMAAVQARKVDVVTLFENNCFNFLVGASLVELLEVDHQVI